VRFSERRGQQGDYILEDPKSREIPVRVKDVQDNGRYGANYTVYLRIRGVDCELRIPSDWDGRDLYDFLDTNRTLILDAQHAEPQEDDTLQLRGSYSEETVLVTEDSKQGHPSCPPHIIESIAINEIVQHIPPLYRCTRCGEQW
jgi:hypothetical protein